MPAWRAEQAFNSFASSFSICTTIRRCRLQRASSVQPARSRVSPIQPPTRHQLVSDHTSTSSSSPMAQLEQQIQQWFAAIDTDRTGSINAQELQRAMALGGLSFSLQACSQMVRLHDRDDSGTISLAEFRTLHMQLTDIKASWTAAAAGGDSISAQQAEQLVAQQGYRLEPPAVRAACQAFDPDRNGRFGLPEYTMLCLFLKSSQNMFRAFDPQGTGCISLDYSQFVYCAAHTK